MNISDIVWPESITMDQIIKALKKKLLHPGISALLGYMPGGPVGAAVAGSSNLAKNIIEKTIPEQKKEKALELTQKNADSVTKVYGGESTPN